MRFRLLTMVLAASAATAVPAQQPSKPPKLIVAISVDQLSADLFDEYRPHFTGGFARLTSGAVFRNGYQAHNASETCPGHSTILTGAHPARNGIVANFWYDLKQKRDDKGVYCAEDERVPGSSTSAYTVSPYHLLVPTLGDRMKEVRPGSRNVAVSGKDRGAVMMSGHNADQRWYWVNNKFDTDLKDTPPPQAAVRANAAIASALAQPRPPLEPPALCQAKAQPIAVEGSEKTVGAGRFARNEDDASAFRASPELDGATLALAAALVDELQLGGQAEPDLLSISLSATDYVGHSYGTGGSEMCLQLLDLDRELGDFLKYLDSRAIDYVVALTADHGGLDIPERKRLAGDRQAARVDPNLNAGAIGLRLVKQLGLPGFGLYGEGSFGDMYVDPALTPGQRKRLMDAAVAAFRAHPQVEAVFTAEQIAATSVPKDKTADQWTLIERVQASYYPGRSGDFVVLLKKDITPIADTSRYVATHGSPWDYDRRVPILFWRRGMAQLESNSVVETVDIMPTLAAAIGLPIDPNSIDGECLSNVSGVTCPSR